jgi:hypothetical protein
VLRPLRNRNRQHVRCPGDSLPLEISR